MGIGAAFRVDAMLNRITLAMWLFGGEHRAIMRYRIFEFGCGLFLLTFLGVTQWRI